MKPITHSDILFIINPNSGRRRYRHLVKQIREIDPGLTCLITDRRESVKDLFERIIDRYTVFILVGGDGTVHTAARYLCNRDDKILGVVPNGSGNGFAYELGFSRNIRSLIEDIYAGQTIRLDVTEINGLECINLAGVGFDGYIAHRFSEGKTRGFFTYAWISIRSVFRFRPLSATIRADGLVYSGRFMMICLANNKQFGNYAFIAPMARPDDSILDIVMIRPFPAWYYPAFVLNMFLGRLKDSRYVKYVQTGTGVVIEADSSDYHIDGEPVTLTGPVRVVIGNKFLRVVRTRHNRL